MSSVRCCETVRCHSAFALIDKSSPRMVHARERVFRVVRGLHLCRFAFETSLHSISLLSITGIGQPWASVAERPRAPACIGAL